MELKDRQIDSFVSNPQVSRFAVAGALKKVLPSVPLCSRRSVWEPSASSRYSPWPTSRQCVSDVDSGRSCALCACSICPGRSFAFSICVFSFFLKCHTKCHAQSHTYRHFALYISLQRAYDFLCHFISIPFNSIFPYFPSFLGRLGLIDRPQVGCISCMHFLCITMRASDTKFLPGTRDRDQDIFCRSDSENKPPISLITHIYHELSWSNVQSWITYQYLSFQYLHLILHSKHGEPMRSCLEKSLKDVRPAAKVRGKDGFGFGFGYCIYMGIYIYI